MTDANEFRLFVSSTFRDLQEEREYLVKKIFPEIRDLCRRRGVTFTEIDLRWGLTEEEGALGRVIRTCLEEVDKCRPHFIGLFGDRYGWVPEYYEVMMDPDLLSRYPWVEGAVMDGASVTELEITHGVLGLEQDAIAGTAHFYHRGIVSPERIHEQKLLDLIEKVRETGLPFREFSTLNEMGQMVRSDLLAVIQKHWPEDHTPSSIDLERRSHAAFASSRRRAYILNPQHLREFTEWLESDERHLLVGGASGLGKSSLLAFLADFLRKRDPDRFVVEHYIGSSETSGSAHGVMRHLIREIEVHLGREESSLNTPEEIEESFRDRLIALGRHARQHEAEPQPVIMIDAINQLGERGRRMDWLPATMPEGIRLVISSTSGETQERLAEREWKELKVEPLGEAGVRKSIVVRYLGEFHKGISAEQLDRLTHDEKATSPLYLSVVAEELRLHGDHDTLNETITRYTGAANLDEVFQLLLERLENDYGTEAITDLLGLISTSHSGLNEREILELTGLSRMHLSHILFALDYHLIRREGIFDFFHSYLRRGVEARYMSQEESVRSFRLRIADLFERTVKQTSGDNELVPLRLTRELCYQLREAGRTERLAAQLSTHPIFLSLTQNQKEYDLLAYWKDAGKASAMFEGYARELAHLREQPESHAVVVDWMEELGAFYTFASHFREAAPLLQTVYRYRRLQSGPDSLATATSMEHLAEVLYHLGEFAEAEELWERALEIVEGVAGKEDPRLCPILDSLGAVYYRRGEMEQIEESCMRSLRISEVAYGRQHPKSIDRLLNFGEMMIGRKRFDRAVEILAGVVRISEQTFGEDHPTVAKHLVEYGYALGKAENFEPALVALRRACLIYEATLPHHIRFARAKEIFGYLYLWMEQPKEAEQMFRDSYRIREDAQGAEHGDTIKARSMIATALRRQKKFSDAERIIHEILPKQIALHGEEHPYVKQSIRIMINIFREWGRTDELPSWESRL